ncbi:hypothetical protein P5673_012528 [Acropora cervicornis]|uniref:Uncharacterized protein n=1 Tax=Acropora cervicornis TaxID=6130 RepID=A0AAD9V7M7_ACRCE|nr:hypothetical protein P5673_012528 [Acropora cervicornis]
MWRSKRASGSEGIKYKNILPGYKVRSWSRLLSIASNKVAVVKFLVSQWKNEEFRSKLGDRTSYGIIQDECWKLDSTMSTPVPELKGSREEADTPMILHAHHAGGSCVFHSSDADVEILLLSHSLALGKVPSIDTNHGEEAEELSLERRTRWIAAISRDDLTEQILKNDRVCSRRFVSGQPAKDFDKFNVDWVPTLNMGHSERKKKGSSVKTDQDRAERAKARRKKKLNETKADIEKKKLHLNDEGTQACNISFTPLSGHEGLSTE